MESLVMAPDSEKTGKSVSITLSNKAYEEFEKVATAKGIAVRTLLRFILEEHHQSPGFGALVRRAETWIVNNTDEDTTE